MRMKTLGRAAAVGLGILLAPVWCAAAWAERRVALVIGNSTYQNAPSLINPSRDAKAIAARLRSGGFDVVNAYYDIGYLQLRRVVRQFEDAASDADILLVFYAGH